MDAIFSSDNLTNESFIYLFIYFQLKNSFSLISVFSMSKQQSNKLSFRFMIFQNSLVILRNGNRETIYYIIANIRVLILIMNRDNLFHKSYITEVLLPTS